MNIGDKIAFHRNGISGNPFYVGIINETVDEENKTLLIIQFLNDKKSTAVFDFDLLKKGIIEFGHNSWRGDHFESTLQNKFVDEVSFE